MTLVESACAPLLVRESGKGMTQRVGGRAQVLIVEMKLARALESMSHMTTLQPPSRLGPHEHSPTKHLTYRSVLLGLVGKKWSDVLDIE